MWRSWLIIAAILFGTHSTSAQVPAIEDIMRQSPRSRASIKECPGGAQGYDPARNVFVCAPGAMGRDIFPVTATTSSTFTIVTDSIATAAAGHSVAITSASHVACGCDLDTTYTAACNPAATHLARLYVRGPDIRNGLFVVTHAQTSATDPEIFPCMVSQ